MPLRRVFRIQTALGPEEIFRALRTVCEHPHQRGVDAQFDFDWLKRRIALSAATADALEECVRQFLLQMEKLAPASETILPGKAVEEDGRHTRPMGVLVHDAATFGELIGRSLVEMGIRGVKVVDSPDACRVLMKPTSASADIVAFVREFPVPPYVQICDDGELEIAVPEPESTPPRKVKRGKKR